MSTVGTVTCQVHALTSVPAPQRGPDSSTRHIGINKGGTTEKPRPLQDGVFCVRDTGRSSAQASGKNMQEET